MADKRKSRRLVRDFAQRQVSGQNPRPEVPRPPPPPPPPRGGSSVRPSAVQVNVSLSPPATIKTLPPKITVPTKPETLTGKARVKINPILLRGLVKPSRSPQEIARRAYIRGFTHCLQDRRK